MTNKRPRGRPCGTGKNDMPFLAMVADLMVKSTGLKPTTAMKRIVASRKDWEGASDVAVIRRWQEKWKVAGESLLAEARERAKPRPAAGDYARSYYANYSGPGGAIAFMEHRLQAEQRLQDMIDPPALRAIRQLEERERRMQAMLEPPWLTAMRQFEESQRRLMAIYEPPRPWAYEQMAEAQRRLEALDRAFYMGVPRGLF